MRSRGALGAGVALAWAVLLRLWQIAVELVFVGLATLVARAGTRERTRGPRRDRRRRRTED